MNSPLLILFVVFPFFLSAQIKIAGTGSDRGKFIINDGGRYVVAAEVEDPATHPYKFLVFSSISGHSVNSVMYKGGMRYAINRFIKNSKGNYIALGERYLEGGRESMLLIEMNTALTPVRVKASYENGNEVEPYDIIEYGNDYYITGYTKTSQLLSTGMAYITREKQSMYLTRYDAEFNQKESYIIGGFDENVNPSGKRMVLLGNNLILAGNVAGEKGEIAVINIDLLQNKITWSKKIVPNQSIALTDMLVTGEGIMLQCTMGDNFNTDEVVVVMDNNGNIKRAWQLAEDGMQRSQCLLENKPGELILFGVSGENKFETKRAAYLFSPITGRYKLNLQGDGIQSEVVGAAKTSSGSITSGYEFSGSKKGIDVVLRHYQDALFTSPVINAREIPVADIPLSLSLDTYPITSGIFKSELFFEDMKYEPYYIWHVE